MVIQSCQRRKSRFWQMQIHMTTIHPFATKFLFPSSESNAKVFCKRLSMNGFEFAIKCEVSMNGFEFAIKCEDLQV